MKELIIIKSVDENNINNYINIFDASLCFVRSTFARIASSPTKIGESFACGVPIICNKNVGDLNSLLPKIQKIGLHDFSNKKNIKFAIDDLLILEKIDRTLVRENSKKYLDLSLASSLYKKIYNNLN